MKKVIFVFSLQSVSDIITNSSSEMFVAIAPKDSNYSVFIIEKILEDIHKEDQKKVEDYYKSCNNWQQTLDYMDATRLDSGSGNGGECDIEILTWKEISYYIRKCNRSKYDKKNGVYLKIEIDHSRKRSIDWIRNNLDVVYFEDHS